MHEEHTPAKHRYALTSTEPLIELDNSAFGSLMSAERFQGEARSALAGFKSRWNTSEWMRRQQGYLERSCLAATSEQSRTLDFCRCGLSYKNKSGKPCFQTCKLDRLCPGCNYRRRVQPCVREYLPTFDKVKNMYALTVGWQSAPDLAGMHFVTRQDAKGRPTESQDHLPFANNPTYELSPRYSLDHPIGLQLMADLPMAFASELVKRGHFAGLYCTFEWFFAFYPLNQNACCHVALPHLHCFGNRPTPLSFHESVEIHTIFKHSFRKLLYGGRLPSYPDIAIAPIVTKDLLAGWINYQIKSMPLEKYYQEGIRNKCTLRALNQEFHQTVWDAINLVRSPRKFGNMFSRNASYLGEKQFRPLTHAMRRRLENSLALGTSSSPKMQKLIEQDRQALEQRVRYKQEREMRRIEARQARSAKTRPSESNATQSPADGAE